MYPPLNVRDVAHLTPDSAPREITGTCTAGNNHFNSSTISMTHIDKTAEALLRVLHYHDAGMERKVYGHLPTRTGFQIPVGRASRKHMNYRSAAGHMRADVDQTEAVYIHKQLAMLFESVGIIISPLYVPLDFVLVPIML
ncbi:hypothetical protein CHS0354_034926 [Potamilus streckersoni]|uniref:Uncharacterized protein n=1 Tax=Potamilus streckersoni TaxID=2493646 RepID=A0AAE0SDH4_9BIVA|nr:hypothetical protein CHS0354_034926 [Potamilus streckersoni]